jgi:hypothetical protein
VIGVRGSPAEQRPDNLRARFGWQLERSLEKVTRVDPRSGMCASKVT